MRDFSWNVFRMTGDVDAYLLYKEIGEPREESDDFEEEQEESLDS